MTHYRVCTKSGHWIGIIETNHAFADPYWRERGHILVAA